MSNKKQSNRMKLNKFYAIALLRSALAFSWCNNENSSEKDILEFWVDNVQYDKTDK